MGAADSREGNAGIVTVSREQPTDKIHPILVELQALRQIPPLLQEGKDPAWRNLQQDLQLMHQKDSNLAVNTEAIVRIVEKYKAWCQAHAAATVEKQEVINERVEEVKRLSSAVIADLTRSATEMSTAATQAELVEDLSTRLAELEQRVSTCTRLSEELRTAAATRTQSTS